MEEKKKSVLGKIIPYILVVVIFAGYFIYNSIKSPNEPGHQATKLSAPKNVEFNSNSHVLVWDSVQNASCYIVNYNGTEYQVSKDQTRDIIEITALENTIKIKAVGDNVSYTDSDWSNTITYNIPPAELSLFDKVNIEIGKFIQEINWKFEEENWELKEIIGISAISNEYVVIETVCEIDGQLQNRSLTYVSNDYGNAYDVLNNIKAEDIISMKLGDVVDYDAASALLESKAFVGKMQELKFDGYNISVVNSCTRKGEKREQQFRYDILGTYKAVRGAEEIYFTTVTQVDILYAAKTDDYSNYVKYLKVPEFRTLKEKKFLIHEPSTTLEYMQELVNMYENK